MAKKKSLKAKLAKKAKTAADSPSRNTSSPAPTSAEPAPSTSKNVEPARKEKKLLGPSVSTIKRPLLRRDPAVSKKAKKYIKDPRLIPRIMEHLDSNKNKNFVSIPLIAEELQKKYPEYARKKKSAFLQYVDRAYSIIADPGESDESDFDSSDDSNDEGFFPDEAKKHALEKERKRKIKEAVNKAMNRGKDELTVPDVDDMPDDETLVPYQDSNSLNNMMSNMYRMNNKRTDEPPPSKQQCIAPERKEKFKEKIMYPSPDVLKKLGKKEIHPDASKKTGKKESLFPIPSASPLSPTATVYTKQTTECYFIDKTGTTTSSSTFTTTTVTNTMSGNKDSRETNIQKFLGNLPSRVVVKPTQQAPPPGPVSPPPLIAPPTQATPTSQAPPLSAKERRRRDPYYKMAKRDGFVLPTPPTEEEERRIGEAYVARQKAAKEKLEAQMEAARAEFRQKQAIGFPDTPSKSRRPRSRGNVDNQTERPKGPEIQKSSVKFADFGGNEKALQEICQLLVHLRHPEVYRQLGVTPPRGFLLHGPPGCGKTLLANAIAGELELPYIKIAATEIVSGVSGNSEEKIRDLFDKALASAPCIVFIDEIDSITPKRETASKDMERRIVSQLLTCLDDLNTQTAQVLVIGATNRPDSLDPALRRAGRFDREISLGIPDENSRMKILEVLCRDLRLTSEFDFKYLAHNTPGFVGADLMALTREAAMTAVNRVFHELQGPSACSTSGSSSQSNEIIRSDLNQSEETGSQKQTEKSNVSDDKTVTQSNGNINDDSAENLYTWTQDQHRKKKSLIENGVSPSKGVAQSNGIDNLSPKSSGDKSTHGIDTHVLNGVTNGAEKTIPKENAEKDNGVGNTVEKSVNNKLKHDGGREILNGVIGQEDMNGEMVCDNIPNDATEKSSTSSIGGCGQTGLNSVLSWLKEQPPLTEDQLRNLYISLDDFKEALKHVQPSAKREGFATIPDVTWDDIGALHEVREELQLAILAPVRHAEEFKSLGLNRAQGILLAGPPGCGKTLLAKAVANESGINFISVKGPELLNMYVGESEKAVRTVFQRARNSAPCVIFFDELDALCPRRSDSGEGGSSVRVVNQLLTEMDGLEERKQVFIMAATNRPDIIDPAVLRPGRLDKTLYVGLPTMEDRLDILRCITKNGTRPKLDSDTQLDGIAGDQRCEGYTGADLAALVREASIAALKQAITNGTSHDMICVNKQHYETAFTKVKPSVSAKDQEKYKNIKVNLAV